MIIQKLLSKTLILSKDPSKFLEVCSLYEGFEDIEAKVACFTDHQIFERYHKYKLRSSAAKKEVLSLKELIHLKIGDFVTHIDHGIGKFGGLQKIDVDGVKQEAIKLSYGEGDILYLSIHSLYKITKFKIVRFLNAHSKNVQTSIQ